MLIQGQLIKINMAQLLLLLLVLPIVSGEYSECRFQHPPIPARIAPRPRISGSKRLGALGRMVL